MAPRSDDQTPKMNTSAAPWTTPIPLRIERSHATAPQSSGALLVWKDAALLHYRAANILLQVAVWLFSCRLLPTSALEGALRLSSRLKDRGAYFHAQVRWRRLRARL